MFPVITWEMLLTPDNGLYDIYALYFFAKKVTNHLVHIDGHWHLQSNLSQRRGYSVCTAKKRRGNVKHHKIKSYHNSNFGIFLSGTITLVVFCEIS